MPLSIANLFVCWGMILMLAATSTAPVIAEPMDVWIGTSSASPSRGIYHCRFDTSTGSLTNPELAAEIEGPGFLAMHPSGSHLYAVGALQGVDVVAAYEIERAADGAKLRMINSLPIGDGGACHVAVDTTGRTLLTAQYGGGSVAAFALHPDGSLAERTTLIDHQGASGVVADRQSQPHAHWVGFAPDNRFAFVPDLGLDQVMIYRHDTDRATITPNGAARVPAGGGPRHMKFHPLGKWAYVLNELAISVTVFDYNAQTGQLTSKQTIPAVKKTELAKEVTASASEIRVHPSGKFVYSANRGHDTITAFAVDQQTGELSVIEVENSRAAEPRNFNLDPTGNWLLVAGQNSHTLGVFAVNPNSGELQFNRQIVSTPAPICVLFDHE
jgi:6-phosphogluconolactonase